MLKWKIDKNVIAELYYNGQNIIKPWGFETADSSAFFSLEDGFGYRYKVLEELYEHNDNGFKANLVTQMKEGKWKLNIDDKIEENTIIRKVEAVTLEDTIFMDFVMRFRFKKEFIEYVQIADKTYYHNDTNLYYQYPVDKVFLKGKGFDIKISVVDKIVPTKMEPVMYVRDNKDEWVVHIRMFPKEWDKEVIKICKNWAKTRPLPQFLSQGILKNKKIKNMLWYSGENNPIKNRVLRKLFNPAAFAMVQVPKGNKLMWNVKMEIV